ncbi:nucleotidyltransferase domain-containing protein [Dyadobacter psychrotolerans]|uniref:Nucleotidyltransferase domain-containing protein n=1 Tax=Dyadobacter psychrotolerans TaxID=2541721 RepID=A0A4R5DKG2_9BACT|nr:nucleotidyltransferase domain-containing protein [Dyadobacter psychrotolerans]TDE12500.1 nucleotidyltransferase domain-containing protein [Dyadobacter psychrotolerans]
MIFGLKEAVVESIQSVFASFPQIEKAVLYGSRAKENYRNGSDIDLTLFGNDLNLSVINKIELKIDDLLLPYTFDISIFHQISNPDLIEHINQAGKIFYEKSLNGAE